MRVLVPLVVYALVIATACGCTASLTGKDHCRTNDDCDPGRACRVDGVCAPIGDPNAPLGTPDADGSAPDVGRGGSSADGGDAAIDGPGDTAAETAGPAADDGGGGEDGGEAGLDVSEGAVPDAADDAAGDVLLGGDASEEEAGTITGGDAGAVARITCARSIGNAFDSRRDCGSIGIGAAGVGSVNAIVSADVNGDHRADLVVIGDAGVGVALSDGAHLGTLTRWASMVCAEPNRCRVGDVNGDGRADVVQFQFSIDQVQGKATVALSNGSSFDVLESWNDQICYLQGDCQLGDVNGDGIADVVAFSKGPGASGLFGPVTVNLSDGQHFGDGIAWSDFFCVHLQLCLVGDINGDSQADLLALTRGTPDGDPGDVYFALSLGLSLGPSTRSPISFCFGQEQCFLGDVDGDGRADLVDFVGGESGDVYVALASMDGRYTSSQIWNPLFCLGGSICAIGDMDGDGRADIVALDPVP